MAENETAAEPSEEQAKGRFRPVVPRRLGLALGLICSVLAGGAIGGGLVALLMRQGPDFVRSPEDIARADHEDFVAHFIEFALLEVAIDDNVDRQQRLAQYFASVTVDPARKARWLDYANYAAAGGSDWTEPRRARLDRRGRQQAGEGGPTLVLQGGPMQSAMGRACAVKFASYPARWNCIAQGALGLDGLDSQAAGQERSYREAATPGSGTASGNAMPVNPQWPAFFAAWVLLQSGVDAEALPRDPLELADWRDFGREVLRPPQGSLALFRPSGIRQEAPWLGFYLSEDANSVQIVAGDRRNRVTVQRLPKQRLIGYRVLDL